MSREWGALSERVFLDQRQQSTPMSTKTNAAEARHLLSGRSLKLTPVYPNAYSKLADPGRVVQVIATNSLPSARSARPDPDQPPSLRPTDGPDVASNRSVTRRRAPADAPAHEGPERGSATDAMTARPRTAEQRIHLSHVRERTESW
jgi:hypothetical protein